MKEANATPQQAAADKDLAKFSADGAAAFEDMLHTRRALYEGRTDDAKKFVALADAGVQQGEDRRHCLHQGGSRPKAAPAEGRRRENKPVGRCDAGRSYGDEKKPIAWVPIDGSITIMEDITGEHSQDGGRRGREREPSERRPRRGSEKTESRRHRGRHRFGRDAHRYDDRQGA